LQANLLLIITKAPFSCLIDFDPRRPHHAAPPFQGSAAERFAISGALAGVYAFRAVNPCIAYVS
jgi:hypothetical protein